MRHLIRAAALTIASATIAVATIASAQGRCIRAYGTPACNADAIKPVFEKTGWRTTSINQITFRVAEPEKEAAFYVALMGWKLRSEDAKRVVMDVGDWGTVIFRRVPVDSFPPPAAGGRSGGGGGGGAPRAPVTAVVEGFGFDIEPWNAQAVKAALEQRGMKPVADNDGKGFESFHVKDLDGWDLQIGNGQGWAKARRTSPANAKGSAPAPFESTGWQTVWLDHFSYGATNYKASVSFYMNLLGWGSTYDEGSQNELMMADVGNIIIRGGNPLDPAFGQGRARAAGSVDHISFGISPWDTDGVVAALQKRGLVHTIDTSDGMEIHAAQFKSYHTRTPNGYNLQISYNTLDTRLNLAIAVNPRRPGNK